MNEATEKKTAENRDKQGRFAKGNRLGTGRPRGTASKILLQCRDYAEQILPNIFERALQGDYEAQKLILTYGMPKVKAESLAEPMPTEKKDILEAVQNGDISTEKALQLIEVMQKTSNNEDDFLKNFGMEKLF